MTEDQKVRSQMQDIAGAVHKRLPKDFGFIVLVFPFGDEHGRANYVSNTGRDDAVLVMREFITRHEKPEQFGTHQP